MNAMWMLVRREFWEHRMLLIAPTIVSAIYLVLCFIAGARFNVPWFQVPQGPDGGSILPPGFFFGISIAFGVLLYAVMAVVAFFYLCDCLYAERKDRSILFWKSMPVSDTETVLAKLVVGLIGVPLVVFAFALVTNTVSWLAFAMSAEMMPWPSGSPLFAWLKLYGLLLVGVFVMALWFSPVAAYQLLISVSVPRAPFVWTVMPPVTLVLLQWMLFDSWSIGQLIGHRLGGVMAEITYADPVAGMTGAFRSVNTLPLLERADMWIGVAIAVALVLLTIRIRKHRDDT